MCQTRLLSSKSNITVNYCMHCNQYYLWHNNLLLNFSAEKFKLFKDAVAALRYEDCSFPFPDQVDRAIINTPCSDISLAFTWEEWKALNEVMEESIYMREVYNLIQH